MASEVYMHGQVLGTYSFLLKGEFLQPDEYSELKAKYFLPGGETGTAATVLASLGVSVKIDGTHIGTEVAQSQHNPLNLRNLDQKITMINLQICLYKILLKEAQLLFQCEFHQFLH